MAKLTPAQKNSLMAIARNPGLPRYALGIRWDVYCRLMHAGLITSTGVLALTEAGREALEKGAAHD